MNRLTLRSVVILVAAAVLAGLLGARCVIVLLGSAKSHGVAMQRRALRAVGHKPTTHQLLAEIDPLLDALDWLPGDADVCYQLGRDLHRLAFADEPLPLVARRRLVDALSLDAWAKATDHDFLLQAAIASYDRAVAANQLVSGARFWREVARATLVPPGAQAWAAAVKPAVVGALAFDPQDPGKWRVAGDLAVGADDVDTAVTWYRASLAWKLDGVDAVIESLLGHPDGALRLAEAIPEDAEAWRRVASYLYDNWRVDAAHDAFTKALALENLTPLWPPAGEAISDGDFTADQHCLLHPWTVTPLRGIDVIRERHDQSGALRVTFGRGESNWYHVTQRVAVQPGHRYRLSARVRVEGFEQAESFGVEAVHPYDVGLFAADARCYATRPARGAPPWPVSDGSFVTVSTDLTPPPGLRMLSVRLRRFGGDPRAGGRVTFTAVSLQPVPEPKEEPLDQG